MGQVGEYIDGKEDIGCYIERVELYFAANYVEADYEVATFLALIGAGCVRRNLLAPELPKDKSFDELKELLVSHYSPKPILIAERYKFHRRNQHESETVAQFVVELKRLALKSEFGTFLEEALRDRLVRGLKSVQIQKKLLAKRYLTLKKAFETAQSMELANKEDFRDTSVPLDDTVNKVGRYASSGHSTGDAVSCFRCGGKHSPSGCWARSVQCYKCHDKGDLAKMCDKKGKIQSTRYMEVDSPMSTTEEQSGLGLCTLKSKGQGGSGFQVQLLLEGKPVSMEVDTGSAVSIVSKVEYKKWFKHLKLQSTQFHLKTYSGESLSLLGEVRVAVKYQTQEIQITLVVAQGKKPVLLGRDWLEKLYLDWSTIFKVSHVPAVEDILVKYEALFEKGYGHIKLYKASMPPFRSVKVHSPNF